MRTAPSLHRLALACLLLTWLMPAHAADSLSPAEQQVERQKTQPGNAAPVWREVRSGESFFTTNQGPEAGVLIQSQGNTWRQLRNGPLTLYGGALLLAMIGSIFAVYRVKGPLKLHDAPTGRLVQRFTGFERLVHWTTATAFVILATTGMAMLFGKHVLMPVIGHSLFGYLLTFGKSVHNYIGPLFSASVVVMIVIWARDNLWQNVDALWIRTAGGMLSGEHVPSGRFNFGEKTWFWFGVTMLGLTASVSGLIMDFPNFGQTRADLQLSSLVHAIAGILLLLMALGHIYMGTIGVIGAFNSMRTGRVDETWAREHHEQWYQDVKAGKSRPQQG